MRRLLIPLGLVLVLAVPAPAEELQVLLVGDTGIMACNAGDYHRMFANPVGRDIRIKAVEIWMGMSERGIADFWGWAFTHNDEANTHRMLTAIGWDHYHEPTAPANFRKSFAPDWVSLGVGESLYLRGGCSGYSGITANVALFLEYTVAP